MTNEVDKGEQWLIAQARGCSASTLGVHLAWHHALYHYDARRWERVLELYDREVRRAVPGSVMELLDASSLLWRLTLQDVAVAERWQQLADAWEPRIDDAWYAFNDMHAMMAFAAAGRLDLAQRLLAVLTRTAHEPGENAAVTHDIGLPVSKALLAYTQGHYDAALRLLASVRDRAVRSGGSHAQRDVLGLTLVSAAEKAGNLAFAKAVLNERLALRPRSSFNQRWMARVLAST
jgi:hypothetical protein